MTTTYLDLLADRLADAQRTRPRHYGAEDFLRVARDAVPTYRAHGMVAVDLTPGNATRYPLVLVDLAHDVMDPDVPHHPAPLLPATGGDVLVALLEHGTHGAAYALSLPTPPDPDYLGPKFGLERLGDALPLTAFLVAFSDALAEP
jgi:hypothetical protein